MASQENKVTNGPSSGESATQGGQKAAGSAQPAQPYEASPEKAFADAIAAIPIFGPWFVWVFRKWKWQGLVLVLAGFLAGSVLMASLFVFSVMPPSSVPDKYKMQVNTTDENNNGQRVTQKGDLPLTEVSDEGKLPHSLTDSYQFFITTAAELKKANPYDEISLKILELKDSFLNDTNAFSWVLNVRADHMVETVRGFRVTQSGLIELLKSDPVETHFRVPACNKGDTLVALLIMRRPKNTPTGNTLPLFQSFAP